MSATLTWSVAYFITHVQRIVVSFLLYVGELLDHEVDTVIVVDKKTARWYEAGLWAATHLQRNRLEVVHGARGVTRGTMSRAPKRPNSVANTFLNTVRLLRKDFRFGHGGRQTCFLSRAPFNLGTPVHGADWLNIGTKATFETIASAIWNNTSIFRKSIFSFITWRTKPNFYKLTDSVIDYTLKQSSTSYTVSLAAQRYEN